MKTTKLIAILASFVLVACDNEDCCSNITVLSDEHSELLGTWQIYEYGYSPGDEYIVEEVSAEPAQILKFEDDGSFSANAEEFENFKFYTVALDLLSSDRDSYYVTLFEEQTDQPTNDNSASYTIDFTESGNLKLMYRFCIEGCHYGLKSVD